MPPVSATPPRSGGSRVILYHQTHYRPDGSLVSAVPLATSGSGVTHVIVGAVHLNDSPGDITLNDYGWESARAAPVWAEMWTLQAAGIKVLAMLGGAAKGTFTRLDGPHGAVVDRSGRFEAFYAPLRDMLRATAVDGVDLDVEEPMSLPGIVRLIDRLRGDMGPDFTITVAPVAPALVGQKHLSGFSYFDLDCAMGRHVAWYNAQFYCGWGDAASTEQYDAIVDAGWDPSRVVLGLVTNPANGDGWVFHDLLLDTLAVLKDRYPDFGGVMGWEYFNAVGAEEAEAATGGGAVSRPWLWARDMSILLRSDLDLGLVNGEPVDGPATALPPEKKDADNPFLQLVQGSGK